MTEKESRVNILLVDDEPKNLLALEAVLEGLGQNLVKAHSGVEALRHLNHEDFAVILLDVLMPGMNGFEAATLIRQRDRTRYTPIIFLTAEGKTETEMFQGYAVGAIDYLVKPFVPSVLRSKVVVLIDLYRKNEQVRQLNGELNRRSQELEILNLKLKNENEMRKRSEEELRRSEEELKGFNTTLEARVQERTAALEERSSQLTRTNGELEQFVYASSHDLQEPLRTVTSFLQLLERRNRDNLDADSKQFIEFAVKSSEHMRSLINGLLEYSRVTLKERKFQSVDCNSVVSQILKQLNASITESGAKVECLWLPEIYGEPLLLGQLFQNLIGNALKFCTGRSPRIEVGAEKREGDWLFWVKDNGIGIEPRYFQQVFRLFQRLNNREDYPGAGLGLAVCLKTVELHGGKIWCESELGRGSCFYFTIPFFGQASKTSSLEAAPEREKVGKSGAN
jgi:two-component system, sensor histidine kinase and response regulator